MLKSILVAAALIAAGTGTVAAQGSKTIKYTHFQPGREDQPKHAAALEVSVFDGLAA